MTDWTRASAAAMGQAIGEGRLDPRDLADAHLAAIARDPDQALIFARLTPERARAEADAAAGRAREGRRAHPLDGVPISWKDNVDTAGVATEAGSRLLSGRVPDADAPVLATATAAGLVCLGKTHMVELAFSGLGLNPMTATPPNVFDRRRVPGGSSSGAGVSVARRLAAGAIGSDTGGSVRMPACWNGLVGLKTTAGLVPTEGVVPLSTSLDTIGPLTRTTEDAALLLSALTGGEPAVPAAQRPAALIVPETVVLADLEPEVATAFDGALAALSAAGTALAPSEVPEFDAALEVMARHGGLFSEGWRIWGERIDGNPDTVFANIEARFRGLSGNGAEDEAVSARRLAELGARLADRIASEGMLVMPTAPIRAPLLARLLADPDHYAAANKACLRNTRLANLLGLSSLTLPLPEPMCGLMLFAGPREEDRLIAAGRALEPLLAS